LVIEVKV